MDETMRKALEEEFDIKSARLSNMMQSVPEMQKAYQSYEAAVRAYAVKDMENAAKEEAEEVERMLGRCQQAQNELNAATQTGDPARIAQCKGRREDEHLALDLATQRQQEANARYQAAITANGFADEAAYQQAFLAKPAFARLEKQVQPFREEYASLLNRCQEIEAMLSKEA